MDGESASWPVSVLFADFFFAEGIDGIDDPLDQDAIDLIRRSDAGGSRAERSGRVLSPVDPHESEKSVEPKWSGLTRDDS